MTKNKIKLSLIDDYIKICLIKNFLSNNFDSFNLSPSYLNLLSELKQTNSILEHSYNLLIQKLNLNNESLLILKDEVSKNNRQFELIEKEGSNNVIKLIDESNKEINIILSSLDQKVEQLQLSKINLF